MFENKHVIFLSLFSYFFVPVSTATSDKPNKHIFGVGAVNFVVMTKCLSDGTGTGTGTGTGMGTGRGTGTGTGTLRVKVSLLLSISVVRKNVVGTKVIARSFPSAKDGKNLITFILLFFYSCTAPVL